MYGSLHCTSQIVRRTPSHENQGRSELTPRQAISHSPKDVAILFASWDFALTHRDGIPNGRLEAYPELASKYGKLNGRELQAIVLEEISALHLVLQDVSSYFG